MEMNNCQLQGRLTRDMELKYTGNNLAIGKFNIAVNRRFKKEGEDRQADFINCTVFGKQAEVINRFFRKGDPIAVVGRIQVEQYKKEEQTLYYTNVIVEQFFFAGPTKGDGQEPPKQEQNSEFYPVDDDDELPF